MLQIKFLGTIWRKISVLIAIMALTLFSIAIANKPVSSQSITGLNSEISSLRSRISRLESQVRNIRPSNSRPNRANNNSPQESFPGSINNPPVVNDRAIGRSDPLFERLATLLIELKEDVRDIENRLVVIEQNND